MKRFKDILCVVVPGKACKSAIERAVTLAENNQAGLTVVDVAPRVTAGIGMPEGGPISADLQAAVVSTHAQELETLVDPYRKRIKIQTKILVGTPFLEIIREVLRKGSDLVIKNPETADWLDRLFGSDDMHLLRKCPCPVWLVKPKAAGPYRRVLATVDVDESYTEDELETRRKLNRQVLELASSLALSEFAELHVVSVWNPFAEGIMHTTMMSTPEEEINSYVNKTRRLHEENLDQLMNKTIRNMGKQASRYIDPTTHLLKGSARKEIPGLAKRIEADLVVMGTVARTGVSGFIMGNTAETILNQIDCSVLAIKPPGFKTPVTQED